MEIKKIVIVGGGISGLSLLHFLHKRFAGQPGVDISLLEKADKPGGTIGTQDLQGSLFETGPNGFLNNQPAVLEMVHDLGLDDQLITAREESNIRYLRLGNTLHRFPKTPLSLFLFSPRIIGELFIPKGGNADESVYDFARRRFGKKAADLIFDCMVRGIHGGDSRQLNMRAAFSVITDLEASHGSVIKGFIATAGGKKKPTLMSFRKGMGQLIDALSQRYTSSIHLSRTVQDLRDIKADTIFVAAPAYAAADMLQNMAPVLAGHLRGIHYAPMTVAGLVYRKADFKTPPKGFGYLVPSSEKKDVLGALLESNVFPGRSDDDHVMARVMMREGDLKCAHDAIADVFPVSQVPVHTTLTSWPKAIPQYDQEYARLKPLITQELSRLPHMHLAANYWNGISFNDCVKNAKSAIASL